MTQAEQNNDYNYCALPLAAYACRPDMSKGRLKAEPESAVRTIFQRDRDRVIHSSAFRRLKHKTQVFVSHEGDHFRTRLTHTLEVAQIARTLARALLVNEDLAEAVALAHDLGHPPFAHMGEDKLVECMRDFGGFEHNDQSLRIVTALEERYPEWNGLNLSWETLEGIVKHNGPLQNKPLPHTLTLVQKDWDLRLDTWPTVEAQVAAIADDIAYNSHDIEDGLFEGLFTLDDIAAAVPLLKNILNDRRTRWPDLTGSRRIHDVVREIYGRLVTDVLEESRARLKTVNPKSLEDVRKCGLCLVGFSKPMAENVKALRAFLMPRMYHHYTVRRMRAKAERILGDLFKQFMDDPVSMPDEWQARLPKIGDTVTRARTVADYISGMTDRMAIVEHERIFGLYDTLKYG
ncbi:MAG: deoxyguanosinetriphosphate triphosphohydrolase [Proteobacteria bacterium]|nr:deoxyguanosinetriphosphate triphosphohydrolase [Pseudomonadota bacterium]